MKLEHIQEATYHGSNSIADHVTKILIGVIDRDRDFFDGVYDIGVEVDEMIHEQFKEMANELSEQIKKQVLEHLSKNNRL